MQSPEETFFAERIAAIVVPLHMAPHNRQMGQRTFGAESDSGANVNDVDLCKNRTFCCGSGDGCFWKEGDGHNAHQSHALRSNCRGESGDAGGRMPFCMTMMEDAVKSRLLEDKMRIRDLSS